MCFHAAGGVSTKAVDNSSDGFIDPDLSIEHSGEGSLNGLTFAAKDLFDVSSIDTFATPAVEGNVGCLPSGPRCITCSW